MFQEILKKTLLENTVLKYIISLAIFLAAVLVIKLIGYIISSRLKKWAKKTATTIDDFIIENLERTILPAAYFGALYLSINTLILKPIVDKVLDVLGIAVLTFLVARLTVALVGHGFQLYWTRRGKDVTLERSLKGILSVTKVIIWGLAIVFFLDNLGFKISAVIAGLGIGGVAVALAAQAVLGDLFSYFAIIFDRPFEVGDFIIIGDFLGTIEHIGIKTTRVRSLGGEQLVFSNTDLTNSRVRNYKRMKRRRVVFKFGVVYSTSLAQLKSIPEMVKNIIESIPETEFDRAHFFSYGDFSLVFEVVYYVLDRDYNKYMDIQQEMNFALKKQFKREGIEFAFPTQTLHINKT